MTKYIAIYVYNSNFGVQSHPILIFFFLCCHSIAWETKQIKVLVIFSKMFQLAIGLNSSFNVNSISKMHQMRTYGLLVHFLILIGTHLVLKTSQRAELYHSLAVVWRSLKLFSSTHHILHFYWLFFYYKLSRFPLISEPTINGFPDYNTVEGNSLNMFSEDGDFDILHSSLHL